MSERETYKEVKVTIESPLLDEEVQKTANRKKKQTPQQKKLNLKTKQTMLS